MAFDGPIGLGDMDGIRLLPLRKGIYLDIAREHRSHRLPAEAIAASFAQMLTMPTDAFARAWERSFSYGDGSSASSSSSDDPSDDGDSLDL